MSVLCTSGTVSGNPLSVSEGQPKSVTVNGFTTAAEDDLYRGGGCPGRVHRERWGAGPGTCRAALSVGTCTITNTLNSAQFTVAKDFSDNDTACGAGERVLHFRKGDRKPDDHGGGLAREVERHGLRRRRNDHVHATETVPSGYTGSGTPGGTCSATLGVGACTITNTLKTASFTVSKVFSDDSTTAVPIEGRAAPERVPGSPTSVSGGGSVALTVEGSLGGRGRDDLHRHGNFSAIGVHSPARRRVQRIAGWRECRIGRRSGAVSAGCTIYNDLNTTTFSVAKVFSDHDSASVPVSLVCTGGTVAESPLDASESASAEFTVTGFVEADPGSCTATETAVPTGYTPRDGGACTADLAGENGGGCTIYNDLNTAQFTVSKHFTDGNKSAVGISVVCTTSSGKVVGSGNLSVAEGSPQSVDVRGFGSKADTTCGATETTVPPGYTASGDPEGTCTATLAEGSCTITNTLNSAVFSVAKDFSDNSAATVTMHLTCSDGSVSRDSLSASEGSPAKFTVQGFSPGGEPPVSCTPLRIRSPATRAATADPVAHHSKARAPAAARSPTRRTSCRPRTRLSPW